MIDPHVHLRDYDQYAKETLGHGLALAQRLGFSAVFEMPNTKPPIISRKEIEKRLTAADTSAREFHLSIFHGLYAGLTRDQDQIAAAVTAHRELFPRVVGLKLFAGPSTGNLGIMKRSDRRAIYHQLAENDYTGVLAVHCEDPELFRSLETGDHDEMRPAEAEIMSVREQILFARETGFRGTLHICHITQPEAIRIIEKARPKMSCRITCGATPHHLLLSKELQLGEEGHLFRVNPPLRSEETRHELMQALLDGRIDWLESDHAPHTLVDKIEGAAGLPGLPAMALLKAHLIKIGTGTELINRIFGERQKEVFGLPDSALLSSEKSSEKAFDQKIQAEEPDETDETNTPNKSDEPYKPDEHLNQKIEKRVEHFASLYRAAAREYPWDPYSGFDLQTGLAAK